MRYTFIYQIDINFRSRIDRNKSLFQQTYRVS